MDRIPRRQVLVAVSVLLILASWTCLLPVPVHAGDKYWIGGSGYWDNAAHWSATPGGVGGAGQPVDGDDVYLTQSDGSIRNVIYRNATYPDNVLNSLQVDATGAGTMIFHQPGDPLKAGTEYVGYSGTGFYIQSGGTNTVTTYLYVGYNPGSTGTYSLEGGDLSANRVYVGNSGTGSFTQSGGTNTVSYMYMGIGDTGAGTYNLIDGDLSALSERVGYAGTGSFTQSGGTNTMSVNLYLGYSSTGDGTYTLNGGALSANREYVGYTGAGTFTQNGGTNTVADLLVLGNSGSGTYDLVSGILSASSEGIGRSGTGTFTQTGGTNTVSNDLSLGTFSGGEGTYHLSDTGALSAVIEYVGESGTGTFTQLGGTNAVTDTLYIAYNPGSTGTYSLDGGTLEAGTVQLNSGGTFSQTGGILDASVFNQSGGTVNGSLQNQGTFNYDSGVFSGRLRNYGNANFNADFTAGDGMEHYTDLTVGTGRTLSFNGFGMANNGTMSLAGGVLSGGGPLVNNAYMNGYGTISGTGGFINTGFLTQSGGSLALNNTGASVNFGNIDVASGWFFTLGPGAELTNTGTLNLNEAFITGTGTLNNNPGGTISGRGTISSGFTNDGGVLLVENGTTNVVREFTNTGVIQLAGMTASLGGGFITSSGTIQGFGNVGNAIANSGTVEALGGTLSLGGSVTNDTAGLITAGTGNKVLVTGSMPSNAGVVNLTGGIFDTNSQSLANSGQMSGYGTFRTGGLTNASTVTLSGGTSTVNGSVTNQAGGTVTVAYSPAVFTGHVTNDSGGIFKATQTNVTFAGGLTNNGGYISDPATAHATDLVIGTTGFLVGGAGDQWILSNDFENHSAQNTQWDTVAAYLGFVSGADGDHALYLPGVDQGADGTGYANNFAWGTLSIASNNSLTLYDGNGDTGGALYVGEILGVLFTGTDVTNIFLGPAESYALNIYYNPSLSGNSYLGGLQYALAGGGVLSPVPIPSTVLLFASGLLGLVGLGRRRIKS